MKGNLFITIYFYDGEEELIACDSNSDFKGKMYKLMAQLEEDEIQAIKAERVD